MAGDVFWEFWWPCTLVTFLRRRTFLRHHIQTYLAQHVHLPPKAIVLVALLRPSSTSSAAPAAASAGSGNNGSAAAASPSPSAGSNGAASQPDAAAGAEARLQATGNGAAAAAAALSAASVHTNIAELMQRLTDNRLAGAGFQPPEADPQQ
jgi:hypothetical protein